MICAKEGYFRGGYGKQAGNPDLSNAKYRQ